jgi:hypothetical protein
VSSHGRIFTGLLVVGISSGTWAADGIDPAFAHHRHVRLPSRLLRTARPSTRSLQTRAVQRSTKSTSSTLQTPPTGFMVGSGSTTATSVSLATSPGARTSRHLTVFAATGRHWITSTSTIATATGCFGFSALMTAPSRWIGWIEEVPGVNCQESSKDALMESLRVTLREALELNRDDAISAAGEGFEELRIAL